MGLRDITIFVRSIWHLELMNVPQYLAPLLSIIAGVCAGLITVLDDRRYGLGMMALQYFCVSIFAGLFISMSVMPLKLIAGTSVILIMYRSVGQLGWKQNGRAEENLPSGRLFRIIAVLLLITGSLGIGRTIFSGLANIQPVAISSFLLLSALGLLQLSLKEGPFEVALGLFTLMNGFELIYSSLESSLAVLALLALTHIGIAIAISIIAIDVAPGLEGR